MLICCDNEGCAIDAKGRSIDLPALEAMVDAIRDSSWSFALCTGRSVPYVEAMVQILGLSDSPVPMVCEGGAVLYHPDVDRFELLAEPVDAEALRSFLPPDSYREEPGKVVTFSVYPQSGYSVDGLRDIVAHSAIANVNVTRSVAAVDVTPVGVDKAFGISHVLQHIGATWSDVLAIGDSWNDLPMLRNAHLSACPANAVAEVQALVDYVSPHPSSLGVADILRWARSTSS
jgi:hydroxymethylpyrimidine pyrophosphatase-like HAD family hydrolase